MSGTIDIGIPRRTEVSLDARLLSGKLRIPDPENSVEPAERQVSITAKLVSGDLRINRAD
jgi:predicted membrane protein